MGKISAVYLSWEGVLKGSIGYQGTYFTGSASRFSSLKYLMYKKRRGLFSGSPPFKKIDSLQIEALEKGTTDSQIMADVYQIFNDEIKGMDPQELDKWFAEYAKKAQKCLDTDILNLARDLHKKGKIVVIGPAPYYRGEIDALLKATGYENEFAVIANEWDKGISDRRSIRSIRTDINDAETRLNFLKTDFKNRTILVVDERGALDPVDIVYVGASLDDIQCMRYIAQNGGKAITSTQSPTEVKVAARKNVGERLIIQTNFKNFSDTLNQLTD